MQLNLENVTIEQATAEHLTDIFNLSRSLSLQRMPSEQSEQLGFLVSEFTQEEYLSYIEKADHFYVLYEGDTLCGFLYAYSSDLIAEDEWMNQLIKSKHPEPFVLIKQICIQPFLMGKGLATHLYQHLFQQTADCPLFTVIVTEPYNQRSVDFHKGHDFKEIFRRTPPDGIPREVWKRVPQ
ncbi:GNAT family N-acetyltransferase [Candidatus Electrothrix sp.]|uniref:GNAT family N-acetyltransferase n=1 Tax=Candidatus Electrothrix sp. TaxID=2170559 RepID=UPI004055CBF0